MICNHSLCYIFIGGSSITLPVNIASWPLKSFVWKPLLSPLGSRSGPWQGEIRGIRCTVTWPTQSGCGWVQIIFLLVTPVNISNPFKSHTLGSGKLADFGLYPKKWWHLQDFWFADRVLTCSVIDYFNGGGGRWTNCHQLSSQSR